MSNYIIPEKKRFYINETIKYINKTSILSFIGTVLFLIVAITFTYFIIFKEEYFTNINIFSKSIFIIVFTLILIYGFSYSIKRMVIVKKMKCDLKLNDFSKVKSKPINITFHLSHPGIRQYDKYYSISNIKIYFNINNRMVPLWIEHTYIFKKYVNKTKLIETLMSYQYELTYMTTSKYITTNQVDERFNKYLKPYLK